MATLGLPPGPGVSKHRSVTNSCPAPCSEGVPGPESGSAVRGGPRPAPGGGIYSQLLQEAQAVEAAGLQLREVVHAQVSVWGEGGVMSDHSVPLPGPRAPEHRSWPMAAVTLSGRWPSQASRGQVGVVSLVYAPPSAFCLHGPRHWLQLGL